MQTSLRCQTLIPTLLRSCARPSDLHQIHAHMIKTGLDLLSFPVSNLLAASLLLLGAAAARSVFDRIPTPNLFQYNTILRAYSITQNPVIDEPISLFNSLRARGIPLDQFSFIPTLKICARALALHAGRQLHCAVFRSGFLLFINLRNTLIHFYSACAQTYDAHRLFDEIPSLRDSVSWSALMGGYLQVSQPTRMMGLFREMLSSGSMINAAAIVTALSAAVDTNCEGDSLHGYCIKARFCCDLNVATAIASMYSKSGRLDSARRVFDEMPRRDVVLYNCMVDGYARDGLLQESLALLERMRDEGVNPNSATFIGLLSACATSGALSVGRHVHHKYVKESLELDAALGTALVDMYSKSGCLEEATEIFDRMQQRDVKAWTAMIMGFGVHSQAEAALVLFYEMEQKGVRPNEVTFLAVLSACSHGGLVTSGRECFERMAREYGISPGIEHYGCLIDLLGRAGLLEEAYELIKSMPFEGDAVGWRALLAGCRVHGDLKIGELAREALVALGDEHPADSILLSSAYALAGIKPDVVRTKDSGREKTMSKKEAGLSSIELGG